MRICIKTVLILIVSVLAGCTINQRTILDKYVQAHNRHDIEKALSYVSQDISFELEGVWVKVGKARMRELEEWDGALNSELQFNMLRNNGDTLFCSGVESNDWFRAIGIEEIKHDSVVFIFQDGLIHEIIAMPDPQIGVEVGRIISDLMQWSFQNNNHALSGLLANGEFIYSKESAQAWLELLDRWNQDRQSKAKDP